MQALSRKNALRMTRGSGDRTVTHYNAGVVEEAKENGVNILIAKLDRKTGKVTIVPKVPRMVHRPDFCGTFGETHEQAGEGKYINLDAYPKGDPESRIVHGAQHVNPYLRTDGCYATIVKVFHDSIGKSTLAKQKADVAFSRSRSDHLLWEGKRGADGFLATSAWLTDEEIWELACKINPDLLKTLRRSKSGRTDVVEHKSPQEKFVTDLDVMRRSTRKVDAATGDVEYTGGATPYAFTLEQSGFAIDQRFLTYGVDAGGLELAQNYYRMVIGRPEPHPLPKTSWSYLGSDSPIAYLNDKIQKLAKQEAAAKRAA